MKKPFLISGAVLLGIAAVIGWAFELPLVEGTVGAYDLLFRGAIVGGAAGCLIGFFLAIKEKRFIGKFQAFASSFLLCTILAALIAHYSNRTFINDDPTVELMPVKQVTATWKDRGLSRAELSSPPDGYYVFVETDEGTIRLYQAGSLAPEIGPARSIFVQKQVGYWGYPLFSISLKDE